MSQPVVLGCDSEPRRYVELAHKSLLFQKKVFHLKNRVFRWQQEGAYTSRYRPAYVREARVREVASEHILSEAHSTLISIYSVGL